MGHDVHDQLPDVAYLHPTRELECVPTLVPAAAWKRLTGRARRELKARAGGRITDWIAGVADNGGVWAVVLGPAGLHVATPVAASRTWTYYGWNFQPDSLTTLEQALTGPVASPAEDDLPPAGEPLL